MKTTTQSTSYRQPHHPSHPDPEIRSPRPEPAPPPPNCAPNPIGDHSSPTSETPSTELDPPPPQDRLPASGLPPSATPTRKIHPDSHLKRLPDTIQDRIYRFSIDNTLAETAEFIADSFGIHTSLPTVSRFLAWYRLQLQLNRQEEAIRLLLNSKPNQGLAPGEIADLGDAFFSALALEQQNPRAWCQLQQIAIQRAKLSIQIQKYEEHKAEIEKAKLPPPEGGIPEETMALIERELNLF